MIGALCVVLFQAAAGAPAPAPAPNAAAPAPVAAEAPAETETEREARLREIHDRQKLVCRDVAVSGSRIPTRRCTSASDDAAERDNSRAWIDRAQTRMPTKEY